MSSGVCNNVEMDTSPPSVLQKCGNSSLSPLCFSKMLKFMPFPPLSCKNAEIYAYPPPFATMQKWTHLPCLFCKTVEINASPPSVFQKCGN
jgi:hypothetical protein